LSRIAIFTRLLCFVISTRLRRFVISTSAETICHFDERSEEKSSSHLQQVSRSARNDRLADCLALPCHFYERRNNLSFRPAQLQFVISTSAARRNLLPISRRFPAALAALAALETTDCLIGRSVRFETPGFQFDIAEIQSVFVKFRLITSYNFAIQPCCDFSSVFIQKEPPMSDDKKNLFDKIVDAVTDRDEKAAAEAARIESAAKAETEARQKIAAKAAADAAAAKAKAETEAKAAADAAAKAAAEAQAKAKAASDALAQAQAAAKAKAEAEAKAKAEAEAKAAWEALPRHVLGAEETLSHIALKYYGHATEPYWRLIYEANKDVIGDNPSHVRAGLKLVIPTLPADLKK